MNIDTLSFLWGAFLIIILTGFFLAYLYGKKTKRFRWSEYFAIIIWPILAIFAFAYFIDIKIINLFIASSVFGFVFEYIAGLAYHKTLGKKLWEYNRFNLHGYTSLLSLPLWGIVGCTARTGVSSQHGCLQINRYRS